MTELHRLGLLEQAAAVRSRRVSPVELVDHHLARIETLGDGVGAFVTVTAEQARADARAAEQRVMTDDPDDLPPLHGVPTAVKDLNAVAGVPTRYGSVVAPLTPAAASDAVVVRLLAAGLISLGKTSTPEFGLPCYTEPDPEIAPPARTPWDLTRSAGGSSGGAAAAVAAGLVPAAQGSDGGGSIRIPASVCGLVGIKTSRGRVSNAPFSADVSGLGVNGPLARDVRDAAALLDAMAGPAPGDVTWAPPPVTSYLAACDDPPHRLRIGRFCTPVIADVAVDPGCLTAYDETTALLVGLGHDVVEHTTGFGPGLVESFETVWAVEAAAIPIDPAAERRLRPLTRWLRERGRAVTALDYRGALTRLRAAARNEVLATQHLDVVLTPTLARPPVEVGALRDDADPAADFEAQKAFTPFTSPYNMSGQPAMSVPLHWTPEGLPVGSQLVGRPGDERTLVRLAAQLEQVSPWTHRHPECW